MTNQITKLIAAGAIIAIAGIAGVVMWTGTGSGVLADALARVEQITVYMYQTTMTISGKLPTGVEVSQNMKITILIAQDRVKMIADMATPNGGRVQRNEIYVLPQEKVQIILRPDAKEYVRMDLDDTLLEGIRQRDYDPRMILKRVLNCKFESLGRSEINGVDVEGFQTTDPNYVSDETSDQVDVKIWVDVKTQLPVRSETDVQGGDVRIHGVIHDFQWNYPVDADTFKPVIPADYTDLSSEAQPPAIDEEDAMSSSKLLPSNEEGAIAGLKLCADLTGRYPEKLDFKSPASLIQMEQEKRSDRIIKQMIKEESRDFLAGEDEKLSPEEMDRRILEELKKKHDQFYKVIVEQSGEMTDKLWSVLRVVMFYGVLGEEGKDPAYYGSVVTPQDKDKVLMRWKVSDNQYRVIFGNLHAETVDARTLAELEKNLPK